MRSVVFRYGEFVALSGALSETHGSLPLPEGESVGDGEWVLAIFEIGSRRRATAAAARGVHAAGDPHLEFERRDWERLSSFAAARSEHMKVGRQTTPPSSIRVPVAPPAVESAPILSEAPPRSRRLEDLPPSSALESSRVPFGARVLVVDTIADGDELRTMLTEMGLVVEHATSEAVAESQMRARPFDAIVFGLHAPGVDARAFVIKLRTDPSLGDVPVLFVSSSPTSRDAVDAFASGADDFLPRPFRTPELGARLFGLLRRARLAGVGGGTQR